MKQLIASFVEQFKLNLENIRFIDFQFHVAEGAVDSFSCRASLRKAMKTSFFSLMLVNLIKIKYSALSYCYTDLGASCSTKEATGSFFRRAL